ncbi:MAG TPA: MATE family efflux transporter [Candidatus Faecousia faecavium]|nr:MATE family efflux transporter [Candidatus Faecousia faecavium]
MENHSLQENKMGVMPVGKLMVNMALPMIISMLVQALYNVVDSVYVSQVSESAVTALSLAFPVQNLQIGFAVGIGVGVNSLLSKSLGEKNQEAANRTAGNGLVLMLAATALFMLFGFFGVRPYYEMQSTVTETVEGGIAYSRICSVFTLGIFIEVLGERLLQATGRTVHTMISQSVGAIINIILDPILIHGWFGMPVMGIAGAAVATVIGQWVAAAVAVYFNFKYNPEVQFHLRYTKLDKQTVGSILTVGIPSVVMNGIGSVMNFGMNQILQGFTETATGVFGIYFKLQSFFFMPLFGINNATISIIAYNYGARKPDRILRTLKFTCISCLSLMILGLAVFQFFPEALLMIFNPSPEFLDIGRSALRIISWSFPVAAICIAISASFQALGNGMYSTITSLCRQMLVLLPAAYLLSLTGQVNNVWFAFVVAEVASAAATAFFYLRIYRQKIKPMFQV